MNPSDMLHIQVPASTANLGPGFDSIGIALGLYLTVEASLSDEWQVIVKSDELKDTPTDDRNYIVRMAKKAAAYFGAEMPPCQLIVESEIPLARGLGSSASAIVAGIELANAFCKLGLSKEDKLRFASLEEGHPDNVGAVLYGGMIVGIHNEQSSNLVSLPIGEVEAIITIPPFELYTEKARDVLPESLAYSQAVSSSAAANVLVAAAATKDWEMVGEMMERDEFHEKYRSGLIPHYSKIKHIAKNAGAYGSAISGAGPTIISLASPYAIPIICEQLKEAFPEMLVLHVPMVDKGPVIKIADQSLYKNSDSLK